MKRLLLATALFIVPAASAYSLDPLAPKASQAAGPTDIPRDARPCPGVSNCFIVNRNAPCLQGATGFWNRTSGRICIAAEAFQYRPDCYGYIAQHELCHRENPNEPEAFCRDRAEVFNCAGFGGAHGSLGGLN